MLQIQNTDEDRLQNRGQTHLRILDTDGGDSYSDLENYGFADMNDGMNNTINDDGNNDNNSYVMCSDGPQDPYSVGLLPWLHHQSQWHHLPTHLQVNTNSPLDHLINSSVEKH